MRTPCRSAAMLLAALALVLAATPLPAAVHCVPATQAGACDDHHATIQDAVNHAAAVGDTVRVAAGTYAERVSVLGKSLALLGARAGEDARGRTGPETIVTHPHGALTACGSGTVVDGFTFAGATDSASARAAVVADQDLCGARGELRVENTIVRDSVAGIRVGGVLGVKVLRRNWIRDNAVLPEHSNGIYADSPTWNVRVEENRIQGHLSSCVAFLGTGQQGLRISRNDFDRRILLVNATSSTIEGNRCRHGSSDGGLIELGGNVSGVRVERNALRPAAGRAVLVRDANRLGPNSNVQVQRNFIVGPGAVGLEVAAGASSGPLLATDNWWGAPSGPSGVAPGSGAAIVDPDGVVEWSPSAGSGDVSGCQGLPDHTPCDDGDLVHDRGYLFRRCVHAGLLR